eukprot:gene27317-biopygen8571
MSRGGCSHWDRAGIEAADRPFGDQTPYPRFPTH